MSMSGGSDPSRWEALFDDLEAQLGAEERLDLVGEVAERTRRERALVPFVERVAGQWGRPITLDLGAGGPLTGRLRDLGKDWILLEADRPDGVGASPRSMILVHLVGVIAVRDPAPRASGARLARRFGFGSALRVLARDRVAVAVVDRSGAAHVGTMDAVGADWVELSEHPVGEWRRAANVTGRRLIPMAAIVTVTALGPTSHSS